MCTHAVHKAPTDVYLISSRLSDLQVMLKDPLWVVSLTASQHIVLERSGGSNLAFFSCFYFQQCCIFRIYFKFSHLLPENLWLLHIATNVATIGVES